MSTLEYKVGDKVRWNDPCITDYPSEDNALERMFEVVDCIGEDVYLISDGYTEAEVYEQEIEYYY